MAGIVGSLHQTLVFGRRVRVLSDQLAALIPPAARILDVGCGDGRSISSSPVSDPTSP